MSASLVGSEMCIRDSSLRSGRPAGATCCDRGFLLRSGRSSGAGPYACGSVSYTHLTLPTICSV
eukprot:4447886-Alexandrium_andersonii.AAC.1